MVQRGACRVRGVAAVRAECAVLQRGVAACRARVVLQPGACGGCCFGAFGAYGASVCYGVYVCAWACRWLVV